MSLLLFLTIVKSAGAGVNRLFEATEDGAQEYIVEAGAAAIVDTLHDDIKTDVSIMLDQAVTTIEQTEGGEVFVMTAGGKILKCSRVIVCIPPPQQSRITWLPRLSNQKHIALSSCQMGLLLKVILQYDTNHWRQSGHSGEVVSSQGPVCICYEDHGDTETPSLVTFIGGAQAVSMSDMSEPELVERVVGQLSECLGPWVYQYSMVTVKNWADEPWVCGSPAAYPAPGTLSLWPQLRDPHDRVHFGGTETATRWIGYMEGAVESGVRCALEVLNEMKPQCLTPTELKVSSLNKISHIVIQTVTYLFMGIFL